MSPVRQGTLRTYVFLVTTAFLYVAFALFSPTRTLAQNVSATEPLAPSPSSTPSSSTSSVPLVADTEASVRSYFAGVPVMIDIARCESKFRQFGPDGAVLRGGYGASMIGVFQINESVHRTAATALGFNIDTLEGNVGYARHLHEVSGTDPWISSFPCWNSGGAEHTLSEPPAGAITTNLSFGMVHPDVLVLQRLLNGAGFTLATDGPGSSGNETTKFGFLTREAVRRFQCAKQIACSGNEYETGYGFVGIRTRAALAILETAAPSLSASPDVAALQAEILRLTSLLASLQAQLAERLAQTQMN